MNTVTSAAALDTILAAIGTIEGGATPGDVVAQIKVIVEAGLLNAQNADLLAIFNNSTRSVDGVFRALILANGGVVTLSNSEIERATVGLTMVAVATESGIKFTTADR